MRSPLDNLLSRMSLAGELAVFVLKPEIASFVKSFKSDTFGIV
ncbi:MAG: hypothetical protein ACPG77_18270 [Nannocystaceae bacterium]